MPMSCSRNSNSVTIAEVAATAAQPPEELGVLVRSGPDHVAVGGDHLEGLDVVAGQAVLPGEPAHAAAEGEPADPGVRDVAGRGGEPMRLRGLVEGAEQRAALDPRPASVRIDPHGGHRGEVDHQTAVRHRQAEHAVAAAAHADLEVLLAGRTAQRRRMSSDGRAPHDRLGVDGRPSRSRPGEPRRSRVRREQHRPSRSSRRQLAPIAGSLLVVNSGSRLLGRAELIATDDSVRSA